MQITLELPDEVALRAQDAGLLTVEAIQKLLEEAMRRAAGRKLLSMAERLHAAGIPPMNETELDDLIHKARTERKGRNCGWFLIQISSSRP
ncbi:MAG: hypothetical protein ABSB19_09190 [Methylomonas sp.]|jgi:hypothetical protein